MATPTTVPSETAPAASPAAASPAKGPRSYLVMMLLAVFAAPSGLARAYRGEQIGWTRFWIFIGAMVLSIIPFINILAALALLALYVWGAVDVFQLYKTKTDADGGALVTSPRDDKWARAFYIYFLVTPILTGVAIVLAIIFGAFFASIIMNAQNNNPDFRNQFENSRYLEDYDTNFR